MTSEPGHSRIASVALQGDALRYAPSTIVTALSGLATLPIITRLIPPHSFGNYSLMMAVVLLLQVISTNWLNSTMVRFWPVAAGMAETSPFIATSFWLTLALSLGSSALAFAIAYGARGGMNPELVQLIILVPLVVLPFNLISVALQAMRMERRIWSYNALNIARLLLPPLFGAAGVLMFGRTAIHWLEGWTLALWLLLFVTYATFSATKALAPQNWSPAWARRSFAYGLPLIPALMLVKVLEVSDRFFIGYFQSEHEVGLYAAAYTIASMPMELVVLAVGSAAAPLLATIWESDGRTAAEALLTSITRLFVLFAIPMAVGLMVVAEPLAVALTDVTYASAAAVVPMMALASLAAGLQWIAQRGLLLGDRTKRILLCFAVAGAANVVANIWLLPLFGFVVAAWTRLGAYVLLLFLIAHGSAKSLAWRLPIASIVRAVAASGIMAGVLYWLRPLSSVAAIDLIGQCICGVVVYGMAITLLGEVAGLRGIVAAIFVRPRART